MEEVKDSIKGKKILFLSPAFFGYETKIKTKMEEMGAEVDMYDERSVKKALDRALLKIIPGIFNNRTTMYYREIFNQIENRNYDYVFIVKCDMITEDILIELKNTFKGAVFCLYLWDSIENIKGITKKFPYFDRILSFDRQDALSYSAVKFRPLFYADEFRKEPKYDNQYKYDICFCGTIHSDRYLIIKSIEKLSHKNKLSFYKFLYLQSRFIYKYYWLTKKEFRKTTEKDFSYIKKSAKEVAEIVNNSRVVLDIQHPKQTGLTMRTIEMIGMNKKVITTNVDIKNYDFYDPKNIHVVSRDKPEIPMEFILSSYKKIDNKSYEKYSIERWILDI